MQQTGMLKCQSFLHKVYENPVIWYKLITVNLKTFIHFLFLVNLSLKVL